MRRMTKLTAAMLVLTCAMTMAPQTAEATMFQTLLNLTDPSKPVPPQAPVRLALYNNTGMMIRIEMWTHNDDYLGSTYLSPGDEWRLRSDDSLDGSVESDLIVYKPK